MATRTANITLDELVRGYLIEAGDTTLHRYARILQIATAGLRELNMDVSGIPTEVSLDKLDNNTVPLPDDFIDYILIGVINNGNVHYLGKNDRMALAGLVDTCGNITKNTVDLDDNSSTDGIATYPYGTYRNGENTGKMYGIGGGGNRYGFFRVNYQDNYISLQDLDTDYSSIYLQYISDITKVDGNYVVHPYVVEALKAFIYWKDIQKKVNTPISRERVARGEYKAEKKKAYKRLTNFNVHEAAVSFRRANKLAPRF